MLLPFLLAAGVGHFYLLPRLVGPLEEIVYEITEEMRPVAALEAGRSIGLTASIGVASFSRDGDTEHDLVAAADHALYGAKQAGRNRVRRRSHG